MYIRNVLFVILIVCMKFKCEVLVYSFSFFYTVMYKTLIDTAQTVLFILNGNLKFDITVVWKPD